MCGGTWEYRTRGACRRRWRADMLVRSAFVRGEGPMPVDNQVYDRLSHTWWEEDGFLNVLKSALNPSRFGYMRRILTVDLGHDPKRLRILDVGCGGGLLAEEIRANLSARRAKRYASTGSLSLALAISASLESVAAALRVEAEGST